MSHEVETMAYAGELPWHGLGEKVSNDLTSDQMLVKAGLDWNVHEVESYVDFQGDKIKTGQKSLIRSSDKKVLTNVGENWNPVQNQQAFDFFSEFVMSGDMEMHTAGSLWGGKIVWALAKIKESFDVFGEDKVDSYLLFSNPHMYGKSINVRFTPIRVVCNNTLTFSLQSASKNSVKVGHRTTFDADSVKTTLGLASEKFAKYKEMAQFLGSRPTTADALIQYYNDIFPTTSRKENKSPVVVYDDMSKAAKMCYDALEVQPGAQYAAGSWWQAFNSVTYYTDHLQGRNSENRLHNQWFGHNQTKKVTAAEKAVEYASVS